MTRKKLFILLAILILLSLAFAIYWLQRGKQSEFFERGMLFLERKDYDMAIEDFTEALNLQPNNDKAYFNRGEAYFDVGDYDKAIADYTQAIKLNPNYADAYNDRGVAYHFKGDYAEAIADYNRAIKLNPKKDTLYTNRGEAYFDVGDYDKAIADYTQAIKLNPDYANAYYSRGYASGFKEDYDKSIADFTQAIKLEPDFAEAYNWRGVALGFKKGDFDKAIADFTQAIEMEPNYAEAYNNLGLAYLVKGDNDKAIANFTQAIKLAPDFAAAKQNLEEARKSKNSGKVLNRLTAKSSKSNFDAYNLTKDKNFAKDIDKVLKNVASLQTSGKTELGDRRGSATGGFNDGYAPGGSGGLDDMLGGLMGDSAGGLGTKAKGALKAPSARDIDMGSGDGSRSMAEIETVVKARLSELREIYNKYSKSKYFSGKVTIKFTIDRNGDVIFISIIESSTGNAKFDDEIKNKIATWKWKAVKSGNTTPTIPFNFSAE